MKYKDSPKGVKTLEDLIANTMLKAWYSVQDRFNPVSKSVNSKLDLTQKTSAENPTLRVADIPVPTLPDEFKGKKALDYAISLIEALSTNGEEGEEDHYRTTAEVIVSWTVTQLRNKAAQTAVYEKKVEFEDVFILKAESGELDISTAQLAQQLYEQVGMEMPTQLATAVNQLLKKAS